VPTSTKQPACLAAISIVMSHLCHSYQALQVPISIHRHRPWQKQACGARPTCPFERQRRSTVHRLTLGLSLLPLLLGPGRGGVALGTSPSPSIPPGPRLGLSRVRMAI
jgi:hypothetical protein